MNAQAWLDDVQAQFRQYKLVCEPAAAQVSDEDFFASVRVGHWVSVTDRKALPLAALKEFLAESHRLVAAKLPRKTRRALGLGGEDDG